MHAFRLDAKKRKGIAAAGLVLALSLVLSVPSVFASSSGVAATGESTTYGGRAYGLWTHVPLVGDVTYADTGDLSADGGALFGDFTPVDSPAASATVFLTYTRGFLDGAVSEAATSDVTLVPGNPYEVAAGFVYTGTTATCGGVSAASEVSDLTVGGMSVPVTGEPNQVYSIPGVLTLVINEQIDGSGDGTYAMTANALHLTLATGVEAIVSSAYSEVSCGRTDGGVDPGLPDVPLLGGLSTLGIGDSSGGISPMCGFPGCDQVPNDFVTGGGWFAPPDSNRPGRVNFGFNAGPRPGNPEIKGNLNLIDHDSGDHLKGKVDFYRRSSNTDPDNCRDFGGNANFNGQSGRYTATVCDYGEPGRNDRFVVLVVVGGEPVYFADNRAGSKPAEQGALDGGNIQLHVFG